MNYRHRTAHCPICRRLLLLAMEPEDEPGAAPRARGAVAAPKTGSGPPQAPAAASTGGHADPGGGAPAAAQDESPPVS
ncbi:DUF6274 family protein [Streptomyces sp. NPDC058657]|uniref:DUF6274 family protein n=1 Tax=unclassified Streptomyces TaxID=2593676 RepID=UPI003659306A